MQHTPLALPNRLPRAVSDALKVLKGDSALGALRRADKGLADAMVYVTCETAFPSAALPEQSLGRLRSLLLELGTHARVAGAHDVDVSMLGAATVVEHFPVGRGGDVDNPQVHPQELARLVWGWFRRVHGARQEEHAVAVEQVSLPAHAIQSRFLVGSEAEGDFYPPVQRQERGAIHPREGEDALVGGHAPMLP